ncbi:tail fiber domain-containing protein [Aeromonas hydrophila]|uniref:tail fiber domain-containing protein n=1 Tax=Aeromonas hydrophila TaxID=644 RepID=UPI003EC8EB23
MYWPDTNTGVDIEPARKPVASAVRKFFTEGGVGQPPTVPGGDWFNQITNELLNVLSAAGIDPSKTDDDQLLQAINSISNVFLQAGSGAISRPNQEKMRETVSVQDFGGATTNPDNSAALVAAQVESKVVQLPRGLYGIGTTQPDFNVAGGGKVSSNGVTTGPNELFYNPARESVFFAPKTYQREVQGINYPPPRGPDYIDSSYNFVMSLGSNLEDHSKNIRYNVVFGNLNGCAPIDWGYNDVFGGNAAAYAGRMERNTIVGSESMAWLGAPDQAWLLEYQHDWFRQPEKPGDPGWDADGLETQFPGIGARIDAFADYATTATHSSVNTTLGRDSGNHLVKGARNFFGGYRAGAQVFAGDSNTGVGTQALEHMVFGNRNTAFGDRAGYSCLDSFGAVFYGYGAGRTLEDASESIVIGNLAADTHKSAIKSIIIGSLAATAIPAGQLDDALYIGMTATIPLLSGDFVTAGAGVNIQPKKIRARQHVRYSDSGSVLKPRPGLLVEGSSSSNMTIEADATGFCTLAFASPSNNLIGGVQYNNGSNNLDIITNGTPQVRLESGTCFRPNVDNNQALGRTAFRWSTVYAGTGTINTSDANEKTKPISLDALSELHCVSKDAILDAWGDVQIIAFQWLNMVQQKGENVARWHFGVIAQQVRDAFIARGIDGTRYGLLCYDEWDDQYEQVQTNIGVKVTKTRMVPRTMMMTETKENLVTVKREDGTFVQVVETVQIEVPKRTPVPVFESDGSPRLNEQGQQVFGMRIETEEVEEIYQDEAVPEYTEVLVREAGNRWGIRPDQCLFLEAAYQRRNYERLLKRVEALEIQ